MMNKPVEPPPETARRETITNKQSLWTKTRHQHTQEQGADDGGGSDDDDSDVIVAVVVVVEVRA